MSKHDKFDFIPFAFQHGPRYRATVDVWGVVTLNGAEIGRISRHAAVVGWFVGSMSRSPYLRAGGFRSALAAASWVAKLQIALDLMSVFGEPELISTQPATPDAPRPASTMTIAMIGEQP